VHVPYAMFSITAPTRYRRLHQCTNGCTGTLATCTLGDDGPIDVFNRCREGSLDGKEKIVKGRARVDDV